MNNNIIIDTDHDIVYNIKQQCPKWNLFWYDDENEYWLKESGHGEDSCQIKKCYQDYNERHKG